MDFMDAGAGVGGTSVGGTKEKEKNEERVVGGGGGGGKKGGLSSADLSFFDSL